MAPEPEKGCEATSISPLKLHVDLYDNDTE